MDTLLTITCDMLKLFLISRLLLSSLIFKGTEQQQQQEQNTITSYPPDMNAVSHFLLSHARVCGSLHDEVSLSAVPFRHVLCNQCHMAGGDDYSLIGVRQGSPVPTFSNRRRKKKQKRTFSSQ